MLEYVIVWWDVVRIIHATRYIRQVTSFSSIALLLPCTSRRFFSYSYPGLSAVSFPMPTTLAHLYSPSWPRFLLALAAFATSISCTPPPSTLSNSPSHRDIYRSARNAESYSVSLDSLKQVLMSCTPIPRSSPTAYPPLATEHSSGTRVLPSMSHLASKVPCRFLSVYLYSSMLLLLSPLLSSSLPPHSLSVPLFLEPPSSPKNRQVRYYRRHITNAELVVIDWMPGTWICQLVWQTNPFRSSFSPRFLHHPPTFLRMSHFGERK